VFKTNYFPWERSAGVQAPYNLRYDHQTAAANTRHAPNGSGTQNAPSVASAAGDLIFRKLFIPAQPLVNEALSLTKDESLQAAERRYG
jgi:hypothetical protein